MSCKCTEYKILDEINESILTAVKLGTPASEQVVLLDEDEWKDFTHAMNKLSDEELPFDAVDGIEFNGAQIMRAEEYFDDGKNEMSQGDELFTNMLNAISDFLDYTHKAA